MCALSNVCVIGARMVSALASVSRWKRSAAGGLADGGRCSTPIPMKAPAGQV